LHTLQDDILEESRYPVFTFNHDDQEVEEKLVEKIREIRDLYREAGGHEVEIYLVGHSLGAIAAAEYAFSPEKWVEGTSVEKVISIAGRLKNLSDPEETPFYPYAYATLQDIAPLYEKIEKNRGLVELYTIAGENDWLVPEESVLVGDKGRKAVISDKGHLLVVCAHETRNQVIEWLYPPYMLAESKGK